MVKRNFRVNIFDILIVVAVVAVALIGAVSWNNKPFLGDKTVLVEVRFSDPVLINSALPKIMTAKEVFYSGTKYLVQQVSYRTENESNGQMKYLFVTFRGLGNISGNDSIFNGQRTYINQKVEIHADYQLQGYVVDYRYEN